MIKIHTMIQPIDQLAQQQIGMMSQVAVMLMAWPGRNNAQQTQSTNHDLSQGNGRSENLKQWVSQFKI